MALMCVFWVGGFVGLGCWEGGQEDEDPSVGLWGWDRLFGGIYMEAGYERLVVVCVFPSGTLRWLLIGAAGECNPRFFMRWGGARTHGGAAHKPALPFEPPAHPLPPLNARPAAPEPPFPATSRVPTP